MSAQPGIEQLPPAALVALGAAVGAMLRWAVTSTFDDTGSLLTVNIAGSFIIGWLAGRQPALRRPLWLLAGTGFCGGLTSFSTFALDVALRLDNGQPLSALQVTAATVLLVVAAAAVGFQASTRAGTDTETA